MSFKRMQRIHKSLPDEFSLSQLRKAIQNEAGLDDRTVNKYIRLMVEFKMIKELKMNWFRKLKSNGDGIG